MSHREVAVRELVQIVNENLKEGHRLVPLSPAQQAALNRAAEAVARAYNAEEEESCAQGAVRPGKYLTRPVNNAPRG